MNVGLEYRSKLMFDNIVFITMEESEQKITLLYSDAQQAYKN